MFAIWPRRRSRHGCRDLLDQRRSSFVGFTLVFRKCEALKAMVSLGTAQSRRKTKGREKRVREREREREGERERALGLLCCGGCAVRDKNRNGTPSLP